MTDDYQDRNSDFFKKIERNQYYGFWSKCDLIPIPYRPRGIGNRHRRSQNGFYTPASLIMPSVDCGAVYISANPVKFYRNWIERKTIFVTSLF